MQKWQVFKHVDNTEYTYMILTDILERLTYIEVSSWSKTLDMIEKE